MDLRAEKQRLHESIRERLKQLPNADRVRESRSLCKRLLEMIPADAQTLCLFMPIRDEVDVRPVVETLLKEGRNVYLPAFEKTLVFRRADDLSALIPSALHIPEPPAEAERLDPQTVDLVIVPGRAFDRSGNRLGRGNGGYDRWIRAQRSANPKTLYWGVCFECQLVNLVPMEPHDERVDAVITARGVH